MQTSRHLYFDLFPWQRALCDLLDWRFVAPAGSAALTTVIPYKTYEVALSYSKSPHFRAGFYINQTILTTELFLAQFPQQRPNVQLQLRAGVQHVAPASCR